MARYQVLRELLRFNGERYEYGATVELEQAQADPLLVLGAVAPLTEPAPKPSKKVAPAFNPEAGGKPDAGAAAANAAAAAPADGQTADAGSPDNPESALKQEAPGEAPAIVPAPTPQPAASEVKAKVKKTAAKKPKPKK
jgi:hypothetical protein